MQQYLDLLQHVLDNGVQKEDRTGTGTISVFGSQLRFNLNEGFPLLTTKRVHLKSVLGELLWFLSGSTSANELREKYGVTIWDEWQNECGELPNIYGKQMMRMEGTPRTILVQERKKERNDSITYPIFPLEKVSSNSDDDLIGEKYTHPIYGEYIILKSIPPIRSRKSYEIQFTKTGYKQQKTYKDIKNNSVRDLCFPSVFGKGYLGKIYTNELEKNLKRTWENMLSRCYNSKDREYKNYGGIGIFVDKRWLCFKNFLDDAKTLTNWHKKKYELNAYNLDKDYYGSNCYSKETCIWIERSENSLYRKKYFRPVEVQYADGRKEIILSLNKFCKNKGLEQAVISKELSDGKAYSYKGYIFKIAYTPNDHNYRYALPLNQIQRVIDEIKSNPNSRRLFISNWNSWELEDQALPACHTTFQFYVSNNKLSCLFNMRSNDVFLGLPFNLASYALLTMMVAQVCDLELGDLIYSGGDVHIYSNHIEQVKLQLTREPYPLPKMYLNPTVKNIFDFKYEDFILDGYQSHPHIKGVVAV